MPSTLATTHVAVDQPLDLPLTLESGQAFRWHNDGGVWSGFIERRLLTLERDDAGLRVTFDPHAHPDADRAVRAYFRLDDDLPSIYAQLCEDERLAAAVRQHWGLRILRQDPWECLIAFICSQNSNIPRIAGTQERLASTLGEEATLGALTRRAFPSPETLASAGEQRLRELGLGYRARYVAGTAEVVAAGRLDLPALRPRPTTTRKSRCSRCPAWAKRSPTASCSSRWTSWTPRPSTAGCAARWRTGTSTASVSATRRSGHGRERPSGRTRATRSSTSSSAAVSPRERRGS